jgi:acyl-CoA synthetase (AMP-forming)/AMP-acid ligase II/acyl carrier protein
MVTIPVSDSGSKGTIMTVQRNGQPATSLRGVLHAYSQQRPHANALQANGHKSLTYGQLFQLVEYTGGVLRSLGITRSDRVAVVLPNGPDMAASFLGVSCYATCAPLNPAYPRDQFEFYLTDLKAKAVVLPAGVETPARDVARDLGVTVIELEGSTGSVAGAYRLSGFPTETKVQADWGDYEDFALVLHTSGTTSRPKQVPLSHRNLSSSAQAIVHSLNLTETDSCLNVMPLFHIHGLVGVLLSSVHSGGSVVCSAGYDDAGFASALSEFTPTWYSAVPTIHQSVLALARKDPSIVQSGRLRLIRSSSSSLPPAVMRELEEKFKVPVIESYGMTEAAHQMASNPLPPRERKPGSVGLPAGPEMAIMDDGGNLLPAATDGEIVIRGVNVTAGYVNNPQANAEAYTNSWFRTGDLGRTDKDGYIYITGRTKEMINRGGETIAPREIDDALQEHPAVAQAVAFALPHATLEEDVAAAVVLNADSDTNEAELRKFAFERLPPVKVPSRIIVISSIPKGPTGKLKRIGLHELLEDQLRHTYVEPRTDLERRIVSVIEQALEISPVGSTDNFFSLGGDSLKGTGVLAELSREFHVDLPAVTFFIYPTAAELAREITRVLAGDFAELDELLVEIEGMTDEEASQHQIN